MIEWKARPISELIQMLQEQVKLQHKDVERAMYGHGNFTLSPEYGHQQLTEQVWIKKSKLQREHYLTPPNQGLQTD